MEKKIMMAEVKKITKIPETLKVKDEVFTYYGSRQTKKAADEAKKQMKSHFYKIHVEACVFQNQNYFLLYVITNSVAEMKKNNDAIKERKKQKEKKQKKNKK